MGDNSGIEWTDATWNPVTGCTKISPGCDNCYAHTLAERFRGSKAFPNGFDLQLRPERLDQPLRWRRPRRIFVNSMSDLFHKDIPDDFRDRVFEIMEQANWHTFQVLTKRSSAMRDYMKARIEKKTEYADKFKLCPTPEMRDSPAARWARNAAQPDFYKHIWLGVSLENAQQKSRVDHLRDTPCAIRFLSIEPLLDSVGTLDLSGIHWVIVGGESGRNARPMKAEWATEIRDQCLAAKVPFFFKQWGGKTAKTGGKILDGREWCEYPCEYPAESEK